MGLGEEGEGSGWGKGGKREGVGRGGVGGWLGREGKGRSWGKKGGEGKGWREGGGGGEGREKLRRVTFVACSIMQCTYKRTHVAWIYRFLLPHLFIDIHIHGIISNM